MCVTVCGKFVPDEGVVAGYDNRIRNKFPAKWGVQIAGMIFQTHSSRSQASQDFADNCSVTSQSGIYEHKRGGIFFT